MKNKQKNDDDLRIENGLKKKELEDKFGAVFSENSEMPLEMENAWLKNVEAFEDSFASAKTTTVYKFIGQPEYRNISDIKGEEISKELDRILNLMLDKGVSLDTICEVEESELYRFITEELFSQEIEDIHLPGMMSCFTYEEFHPNAKLDIEHAIDYFFRFTMGKMKKVGGEGYDLLYIDTENHENENGQKLEEKYVVSTINNFLKSFDSFEFAKNETIELLINQEKTNAVARMNIVYKAIYNKGKDWTDFHGIATFKLRPSEYGGWSIYSIDFPRFEL